MIVVFKTLEPSKEICCKLILKSINGNKLPFNCAPASTNQLRIPLAAGASIGCYRNTLKLIPSAIKTEVNKKSASSQDLKSYCKQFAPKQWLGKEIIQMEKGNASKQ